MTTNNKISTLPKWVSKLLEKKKKDEGSLPPGVTYIPRIDKYMSKCRHTPEGSGKSVQKTLGYFETPERAFQAYKEFKEAHVQRMAEKHKDELQSDVVDLMLGWTIEA